uniref:Ig-like domain-containing protein n=1 Tax=Oryzias latipes TaxID=8090 RepID=A0A3P9KVU9_ORYLA
STRCFCAAQHLHICLLMFTDAEVSCQFGQNCILPCRFPPGDDLVIHWFKLTPTNTKVHSYYDNKDHLEHQHQRFRGRTSLFQDQISKGNASLQLTGVMVQDQGRYRCLTSTITETGEFYINMKVYAPPQKINMKQTENQIICSSDGIYPQPDLSWSISPPSSRTFQNTTRVQKTEELLSNISSSLTLSDGEDDLDYICTISTPSNQRRASWRRGQPYPLTRLVRRSHHPVAISNKAVTALLLLLLRDELRAAVRQNINMIDQDVSGFSSSR